MSRLRTTHNYEWVTRNRVVVLGGQAMTSFIFIFWSHNDAMHRAFQQNFYSFKEKKKKAASENEQERGEQFRL